MHISARLFKSTLDKGLLLFSNFSKCLLVVLVAKMKYSQLSNLALQIFDFLKGLHHH